MPATALPSSLDTATLPLHGSRLIEASAGTGKTWTIAALYVRLALGHGASTPQGLLPAHTLVMTFTRAATLELSERIRERLAQAARYFRGERPDGRNDMFLDRLLQDYPNETQRNHAAWRLESAAQAMDEAAIHTIDAWCQRVLAEFATLTGMLGEQQLATTTTDIQTTAALDYWRQHVYPLSGGALELVLSHWKTALDWQQQSRLLPQAPPLPAPLSAWPDDAPWNIGQSLPELLAQWIPAYAGKLQELAAGWIERAGRLKNWLDAQIDKNGPHKQHWNGSKLQPRHYTPWIAAIQQWADDPKAPLRLNNSALFRLSEKGLQDARKGDADWQAPPEIHALQALLREQADLPDVAQLLQQHAAWHTLQRFQELKARAGVFDFADALDRVEQALTGPHGNALRTRLAARYPVAMIDEFQDTSAQQYRVFSLIYQPQRNLPETALLVIGDPKQSIYRFRGADIDSYLQVRQQTQGRHYALGVNYRSTRAVVDAINHCFAPAEQRAGPGAFRYRRAMAGNASDNPVPFIPVSAQGRREILGASPHTALPALHIEAAYEPATQGDASERLARLCAAQVVQWLNDETLGFHEDGKAFARLRPADMAILVRSHIEADLVRSALRERGLPSVYLSDRESVFASGVAHDLVAWLQAVASPLDVRLARAALASPMLALPIAELERLADDEQALEQHLLLLQELHGIWASQGVLPMLRHSLHRLNLPARWLANDSLGERKLTNFLHLAELLQQAARAVEGEQALIRWLAQQISAAASGQSGDADEQIVRLESDADLIKIVTIHKSKGLEYPVVLLPFACNYKAAAKEKTQAGAADTPPADNGDSGSDSPAAPGSEEERLREELRLFYVALTRARHCLWLGFASIKRGNGKQCVTHRSAWGYLLAGDVDKPLDSAAWHAVLAQWAGACRHIRIRPAPEQADMTPFTTRQQSASLAAPRPFTGQPDLRWSISSFSALTRNIVRTAASPLWQPAPRRADDEAQDTAKAAPAPSSAPTANAPPPWHNLPGSAQLGNFLHDQLEWLGRDGFPARLDAHDTERIAQNAQRAGWSVHATGLHEWLEALLQTPLQPLAPLAEPAQAPILAHLHASLSELEFWMPAAQLDATALDGLCRQWLWPGHERERLPQRTTHGMLLGFADLVFEHAGRYWMLDYKSNFLGPDAASYAPPRLQHAVLHHRYDLQALLYLLALHRLLQSRLGSAYAPAQHLGGALYWFLRGLDAPGHGIIHLPANATLLLRADEWLAASPATAGASA